LTGRSVSPQTPGPGAPKSKKVVALIGTLDTKGRELRYIRDQVEALGCGTFIVDSGIRGEPVALAPDLDRREVARAAGTSLEHLRELPRGEAVHIMIEGLKACVLEAFQAKRFHGVLSIGGLEGMTLATAAMQVLPIGVPKLMVSPLASGEFQFGPFMGKKDILIMHSIIDILGVNPLSKVIFDNALRAMVGMVERGEGEIDWGTKNLIAVTMMGNTTPAIMRAKPRLEQRGYDPIVFHASGSGGPAMESLMREGVFRAVLDYTPHEITDYLAGGLCGNDPRRLDGALEANIPQVIVPGGMDYIVQGPPEQIDPRYRGRPYYLHNPTTTLVRTSAEEMRAAGEFMVEKLNRAKAPVAVLLPLRGLSMYCHPGEPMHDPEADRELFRVLKEKAGTNVMVEEIDAHINDPECPDRAVELLLSFLDESTE
jgi:uncharacterized protein (UPF0261 family)